MSPCWPPAKNSASVSPAMAGTATRANPAASKPSSRARARMVSFRSLKIELRIMRHRRLAGQAVGEKRPERRPRFHPRIPFGGGRMLGPLDFAEIIQRRQMRRQRKIGEAGVAAGKVGPLLGP